MTALVVVAVVWAMVLTVVILLSVRQIALLTIRLNIMNSVGIGDIATGGELGRNVDTPLIREHVFTLGDTVTVFALDSNCNSCHDLLYELPREPYNKSSVMCLLTGSGPALDSLRASVPEWLHIVDHPLATQLGHDLELSTTQVALKIIDGRLIGRARIDGPADLEDLLMFETSTI